ncbi:MAG TPA: glycosyltransferase family 4 protein [Candidatus Portnoybacteria bacterium]|nr:glycosyltransferase family 4 protein [Candidatus Portnoybacteria bacterium]
MKIAFFCSSRSVVPPPRTGGIEWATNYLIQELIKRGHDITLYAAPGSKIKGVKVREISPFPTFTKQKYANLQERITSFYDLFSYADFFSSGEDKKFDLIHCTNYIFYEILPFSKQSNIPIISQICYPHDAIYPYIKSGLQKLNNVYFLPGSRFIKNSMPGLPYLEPLYPAVDEKDFPFSAKAKDYLFFIGRICPEKGTHLAIKVALKTEKKLIIAGGVSESNQLYFAELVKPYIDNKKIVYVGEAGFKTRVELYRGAMALLFPIQWNEPCGNVMIESMMCGTPVIAFDRAAVREVIKDKVSGYIVRDGDTTAMAKAVNQAERLDRKKIREFAKNNFSIEKETDKYEKICFELINKHKSDK